MRFLHLFSNSAFMYVFWYEMVDCFTKLLDIVSFLFISLLNISLKATLIILINHLVGIGHLLWFYPIEFADFIFLMGFQLSEHLFAFWFAILPILELGCLGWSSRSLFFNHLD